MSFVQRAWLYITRKKLKTLILLAILLCMSTIMLSGFAIKHSTDAAAQSLDKTLKAGFTLGNNPRTNPGTARGSGTVSNKDIDAVKNLEGVTDYVKRQNATVDFINTKLVPLPSGGSGYDAENDKQFGNAATIIGVNKSEFETKFRAGVLKLIAGRHITKNDSHTILVHEAFAKANNLKLGSKIKLKANQYDTDNEHPSKNEVEVEIVGIFNGTNPKQATYQVELFENVFLTDLATTRQLNAYTAHNEIYQDATFFTKGTKQLDEVMARAHKLPVDWQKYQLNKNSQELAGVTAAVNGVYGLIDGMLWATALVSIAVIGIVLYLWMNERKREAGVLLATGVSQSKIVLQYIAELVMIAVLSFGASYATAGLIAQQMGDHVVSQAAQNATRQASSSLGGASLGADADSVTSSRTLEKVTVGVQPTDLLAVWGAGLAVIIIAVLLASRPITQSTPKELLTEVD